MIKENIDFLSRFSLLLINQSKLNYKEIVPKNKSTLENLLKKNLKRKLFISHYFFSLI